MKNLFQKIANWFKLILKAITPGNTAVYGASMGLLMVTCVLWALFSVLFAIHTTDPWMLMFCLAFLIAAILVALIFTWLIKLVHTIPRIFKLILFMSFPLLFIMAYDGIVPIIVIFVTSLTTAGIWVLKRTGFTALTKAKKIVTLLGLTVGTAGIVACIIIYIPDGFESTPTTNAAALPTSNIEKLDTDSPSKIGQYEVNTLTYGSGKDQRRTEYGENTDLITESVDGTAFIDNWSGFGGWWRTFYWGFDYKSLPINARVWYPEGDGPFPLVLIVHGNHSMQDFSDPGYAYLGELLASRGIILASVDENFINASWSDIFGSLEEENDARGWLLLEHLKVLHKWNSESGHFFQNKIDTSKLALIGHSRGGEAVAHAAMLNKLRYYPDDASISLNYNYDIQSVVAIAPVDGQYESGDTRTSLENVDYFTIHGAQDADVTSFEGSLQYERVSFNDSTYHFKSGLYVYGANHGQFNTSWGNNDTGNPFIGLLNLKQLMSSEDQEEIAKVYISAFLEITLNDDYKYLPLFTDARVGADWLPPTIYLNQFEDSNLNKVCSFEEDFDVVTPTFKYGRISGKNLSIWREAEIKLKYEKKGSRALFLGWNYESSLDVKDSTAFESDSLIASYTIAFKPDTLRIDSTSVFVFSMAESTEESDPKSKGKWINKNNDSIVTDKNEKDESTKSDEDKPKEPIDFTISMKDSSGVKVEFLLSEFSALQREIEVNIWKIGFLTGDEESEKVFQLFSFPMRKIQLMNPAFDINQIRNISLRFDQNKKGVVVIDNIGFMKDFEYL